MEENPYKAPVSLKRSRLRFRPRHVPLVIAWVVGAVVLLKLALLFFELGIALVREGLPKIPAPR
ncbi:MAG TPA: hypothetical protein VHC22_32825 [Pirellulales bacterium]|nr:hypothetical protein [Pirellulales bacterium]